MPPPSPKSPTPGRDPIDIIGNNGDNAPQTPPRNEEAGRSSTAQSEWSSRRLWGRSSRSQLLIQLPVTDADSDDNLDYTLYHAPQTTSDSEEVDGAVLHYLHRGPNVSEPNASLMNLVSHVNGIGTVTVPFRSDPEFPQALRDAEEDVFSKAHYQNFVAAQYLFREDEHLRHVGSFIGAGFAWSYSEFHRWQYPLLYDKPLPLTPGATEPNDHPPPKRQTLARRTRRGDEGKEDEENENEQYLKSLEETPSIPSMDTLLREIFGRYESLEHVRRKGRVLFLPILDPHGRTYEAFDVIDERMREWYTPSKKNSDPDHQFVFDPDPYEDGTCPATVARKRNGKQQGQT